jgi:hypothetical protein
MSTPAFVKFGSVEITADDHVAIVDAWDRIDACDDRGEPFSPVTWLTINKLEITVDEHGTIWHDGLVLAERDGGTYTAVVTGSGERMAF